VCGVMCGYVVYVCGVMGVSVVRGAYDVIVALP
jgi:hypothetical protein